MVEYDAFPLHVYDSGINLLLQLDGLSAEVSDSWVQVNVSARSKHTTRILGSRANKFYKEGYLSSPTRDTFDPAKINYIANFKSDYI